MKTLTPINCSMLLGARFLAALLFGATLGGCGDDGILLAEILEAAQQPSSSPSDDPVAIPEEPVAVPEVPVAVPEVPASVPEEPVAVPEVPVSVPEVAEPPTAASDAESVQALLIEKCGECHIGADRSVGLITDIGDIDGLIDVGMIVPGSRSESAIYVRMEDDTMPPFTGEPRPTELEIESVGDFIDSL